MFRSGIFHSTRSYSLRSPLPRCLNLVARSINVPQGAAANSDFVDLALNVSTVRGMKTVLR
jgi:hypothetical protein